MAYTVYQTNKKTGVVYAYRAESYRDPETGKPKSHRTYLGRVDPVTKMIIGKAENGKRNRSQLGLDINMDVVVPPEYSKIMEQQSIQIQQLQQQVKQLEQRNADLLKTVAQIRDMSSSLLR